MWRRHAFHPLLPRALIPRFLGIAWLVVAAALTPADDEAKSRTATTQLPSWVSEKAARAVAKAELERREELLEASEKGEDRESFQVSQEEIDERRLGARTLDDLFRYGDGLFEHSFHRDEGYGDAQGARTRRVHFGARGGLDSYSCAGCHSVGGDDGAGSETQNVFLAGDGDDARSALIRNPPAVLGLGFVQALAKEMSDELARQRDDALARARREGHGVALALASKGVRFGEVVARPDGSLDTSGLDGISADLVVRPFGYKGQIARLRRFVEDAARIHFGIQSHVLALDHEQRPDVARLGAGANWWDPDDDHVVHELDEGTLTAAAVYLALLETPVVLPPEDTAWHYRWLRGRRLFRELGCADCHRESLHLDSPIWRESSDTTRAPPVTVDLLHDGNAPRGSADVQLFSDLKRHDMGPGLSDPHDDPSGVPRALFLTRPLWGLAESAPYLHDGRARTIPEAILAHGGEARRARDAFDDLSFDDRACVHVFLLSLTREPKPRVPR